MKKLILTMVMSMLTFGLAFAASWYLHPPQEVAYGPDQQAVTAAADTASGPTAAVGKPVNPGDGTLPAAVRPRAASVEELVRLGLSLKAREEEVHKMEEGLQKRQIQQQLALADLTSERRSLDGFRTEARDALGEAQRVLEQLTVMHQQLVNEREQLVKERSMPAEEGAPNTSADQIQKTKRLSQWIQAMEPDKAAGLLKQMANDGDVTGAAEILSHFEEREAAKLLSAIDDPTLVNDLVSQFRDLKSSTKTPPK